MKKIKYYALNRDITLEPRTGTFYQWDNIKLAINRIREEFVFTELTTGCVFISIKNAKSISQAIDVLEHKLANKSVNWIKHAKEVIKVIQTRHNKDIQTILNKVLYEQGVLND